MYVYCLPIKNTSWDELDTKLLRFVSQQRREKVLGYRFHIDRKLSLYAALLIRMELSRLTGIPTADLLFHSRYNHKPLLLTAPQYHFSFSHTHNFILCCISHDGAVGADVEKITEAPFEIMNTVYHPAEMQYVLSPATSDPNHAFYKVWTRKEAYTKYLGIGLVENLKSIDTLYSDCKSYFHTWKQDEYMCSVFEKASTSLHLVHTTEAAIRNFYLSSL